jgi:hypothetical protein
MQLPRPSFILPWLIPAMVLGFGASAQVSDEEAAKANNPLADIKAFNIQNYYVPAIYEDANLKANSTQVRCASPFAGGKILVRVTLPLVTSPSGYDGSGRPTYSSGIGDLNFFATYTISKPGAKTLIGVGPQVAIPTGSNNITGSGKWQLGGALIVFNASSPVFQWGGLATFQASIAGQSDRPSTSLLILQPSAIFQLGKGAYLRSSALWNFNLASGIYNVPIGFGAGHVSKAGKLVFNIFLEPQFTMLHSGSGQPAVQIFGGINCQF